MSSTSGIFILINFVVGVPEHTVCYKLCLHSKCLSNDIDGGEICNYLLWIFFTSLTEQGQFAAKFASVWITVDNTFQLLCVQRCHIGLALWLGAPLPCRIWDTVIIRDATIIGIGRLVLGIGRLSFTQLVSTFLPRCMECNAVLTMRFLSVCPSVCPSVCLSNACIVTKRKKDMFWFLYHTKEHLS